MRNPTNRRVTGDPGASVDKVLHKRVAVVLLDSGSVFESNLQRRVRTAPVSYLNPLVSGANIACSARSSMGLSYPAVGLAKDQCVLFFSLFDVISHLFPN